MTVVRQHNPNRIERGSGGTVRHIDETNAYRWIDYRESAARASERPDLPSCSSCGCESDRVPVRHSPRCAA